MRPINNTAPVHKKANAELNELWKTVYLGHVNGADFYVIDEKDDPLRASFGLCLGAQLSDSVSDIETYREKHLKNSLDFYKEWHETYHASEKKEGEHDVPHTIKTWCRWLGIWDPKK